MTFGFYGGKTTWNVNIFLVTSILRLIRFLKHVLHRHFISNLLSIYRKYVLQKIIYCMSNDLQWREFIILDYKILLY